MFKKVSHGDFILAMFKKVGHSDNLFNVLYIDKSSDNHILFLISQLWCL